MTPATQASHAPSTSVHSATALGLVAIVVWSTSIALSRSLTEKLGVFTAACAIYLAGGAVSLVVAQARGQGWRVMVRLPPGYLLGCGSLFVSYMVAFNVALGLARDRPSVVVAGVINYLWPALTLALSVPVLGNRARWTLAPAMAAALLGTWLALAGGQDLQDVVKNANANAVPYGAALAGAVAWSLYSNLSRRLAGERGGAVPLFLLASGAVLGVLALGAGEEPLFTATAALELGYAAVFVAALGYVFWDRGVRAGNLVLLAAASYAIPVASTVASVLYLDVVAGPWVWAGCVLVTAGAVACRYSVRDAADQESSGTQGP
jgi:drug/metabolite transporter (DMT)-like permease